MQQHTAYRIDWAGIGATQGEELNLERPDEDRLPAEYVVRELHYDLPDGFAPVMDQGVLWCDVPNERRCLVYYDKHRRQVVLLNPDNTDRYRAVVRLAETSS